MRDYVQQLTVEQFGGMVATATRTVGSGQRPLSRVHADGRAAPRAL